MKKLLYIIILTFIFQSLTKANDIIDFQIEGMSIGDSLTDYFTKKDIRTEKKYRIKYPNSNKFSAINIVRVAKTNLSESPLRLPPNHEPSSAPDITGNASLRNNIMLPEPRL